MEISLITDIGQKRSNNQDYINKFDNKAGITMIALADGMGGHLAGNIASEMAVTDLGRSWVNNNLTDLSQIRNWLTLTIEAENDKIYKLGQSEDYKGMGTTIEVLIIVDNAALFAHVGDSRIGLVRQHDYKLLTSDHSLVNALLKAGQISEEEAINHPQKNIITQSVGQEGPLEIDLGLHLFEEGDYIIINSDGLTNMVSNEDIVEVLNQDINLSAKNKELIDLANKNGGLDNITIALIHNVESGAA